VSINEWINRKIIVNIHGGELFMHKDTQNHVICRKFDGTGDQDIKWHKPDSQRWMFHSYVESILFKEVELWLFEENGEGGTIEDKRLNMIKWYYIHVWKYHNETHYFVQLMWKRKDLCSVGGNVN
jgi:hypothetical protein